MAATKFQHFISFHPTLDRVKNASANTFREMVKSHLTRVIDIESGYDFDSIEQLPLNNGSHMDTIFGAPLTQEGICCMAQLIDHIKKDENIVSQGIFRQSGSIARQNQLQAMLSKGETVTIDEIFNVYTCCDVLKKFVRELPKPLLTDAMSPLFFATSEISSEEKRLNALRLLILLLPSPNRTFLADLMDLFCAVVANSDKNLMTAQNISIIFGPHFFVAREIKERAQLDLLGQVQATFVFMIQKGMQLFEPPPELLADAEIFLEKRDQKLREMSSRKSAATNLISTTSLIPAPKFCATPSTSYNSDDYTKQQLAELMAVMMDTMNKKPQAGGKTPSKKNKKWLSKLNKDSSNNISKAKGGDTPLLQRDRTQQQLVKEAMKARAATAAANKKSNFKTIFKKTFGASDKSNNSIKTRNTSCSTSLGSPSVSMSLDSFHSHDASMSPLSIVPLEVKTPIETRVQRSLTVNAELYTPKRATPAKISGLVVENCDEEASAMTTPTMIRKKRMSTPRRRSQSFEIMPLPSPEKTTEEETKHKEVEEDQKPKVKANFKRFRTYVNVKPALPPKLIKSSKPSQSATEMRALPIVRSVTLKTFKSETLKPTYSSNLNLCSNGHQTTDEQKTSTSSLLQEELQQVKAERKVTKITAKFESSVNQKSTRSMSVVSSPAESEEYVDLLKMPPLRERNQQPPTTTTTKMVTKKASVVSRFQKPKMPTPPPPRTRRPCLVVARPISTLSS